MQIEQNIVDAISIGKHTNIPVLFMSNPGFGKTTILNRYAEHNGMYLQTLIGSRYTPEELSGYQVNNGGTSLTHMNPVWYEQIMEKHKQGIPTLLFIDELSTCSEQVQGTLLTLIFDRTIGHGKYLPENCFVVAAANYSNNLSAYMNILSPTLNRFIVINLNENYTSSDLLFEFLSAPVEPVYPVYSPLENSKKEWLLTRFKEFWNNTFIKYSDPQSSFGIIDISNQMVGNIYADSVGPVYNFISGRTLSYLQNAFIAYAELGIENPDILNKMIDGLVGAGSCSFKDEVQSIAYREHLHTSINKILKSERQQKIEMNVLTGEISKDIANFIVNRENLNLTIQEELIAINEIREEVAQQFKVRNIIELTKEKTGVSKFISDLEAIIELQQLLSCYAETKEIASELSRIAMNFYGIYCDMLDIKPNFNKTFGFNNNLFERVCYLRIEDEKGKEKFVRGALRFMDKSLPGFYLIEPKKSFTDADLQTPLHISEKIQVLVWNKGMKLIPMDKFLNTVKKAA